MYIEHIPLGVPLSQSGLGQVSHRVMRWLVLGAAYFTIVLFIIGLFDMILGLYELLSSGLFTDPNAVIELLDTVLLLLIIIEVHRTLIAYANDEPVLEIVVSTAIIAVARDVIGFRAESFGTGQEALSIAAASGVLLLALVLVYAAVKRIERSGDQSPSGDV